MGRKNKSDIRKPEILQHVYNVLKTEGLQGTTLSKIANLMGVNASLLVYYFKTKDELMIALTEDIIDRYLGYFNQQRARIERIKDTETRLISILDLLFDPKWDNAVDANVFYSCFYLSFKNPKIHRLIRDMYIGFKNQMAQYLKEHYISGHSIEDESEKTAVAIISLLEGFAYYRAATGDNTSNGVHLAYLKKMAKSMLDINASKTA